MCDQQHLFRSWSLRLCRVRDEYDIPMSQLQAGDEMHLEIVHINHRFLYGLAHYLRTSRLFRESCYRFFTSIIATHNPSSNIVSVTFATFIKLCYTVPPFFRTSIKPPTLTIAVSRVYEKEEIIRTWSTIVLSWLNKKYKHDCYGYFFSTLGGAFSSLGEDSYKDALKAEQVSYRQLKLATEFNDPNAICRCNIFIAFSHIQLARYKEARDRLKNIYKYLTNPDNRNVITDDRLKVMCIAGIKKLRWIKGRLRAGLPLAEKTK